MINLENVIVYTIPPTIASMGAIVAALIAARTGKRNESKLHSIDKAVNETNGLQPTIRENVQELVDRPAPETSG
jgi:predicted acylesterase/phospholipase RssA